MGGASFHQRTRKGKTHDHYCDWYRFGEEHLCRARRQSGGIGGAAERVNDFAAPGVMNLLRRVVSFSGWWSPMVVG